MLQLLEISRFQLNFIMIIPEIHVIIHFQFNFQFEFRFNFHIGRPPVNALTAADGPEHLLAHRRESSLERLIRGFILSHIDAIRERCCVRLENEAAITDLVEHDEDLIQAFENCGLGLSCGNVPNDCVKRIEEIQEEQFILVLICNDDDVRVTEITHQDQAIVDEDGLRRQQTHSGCAVSALCARLPSDLVRKPDGKRDPPTLAVSVASLRA